MFSEQYLSSPVGQILGAVYGSGVISEFRHPTLADQMQGPGKRPSLDFGVIDGDENLILAIESKWIGRTRPQITDIIWDLIRLEMVAHFEGARAFFLLAGRKRQLDRFFQSDDFRGENGVHPRRPIMSHRGGARFTLPLRPTQHYRVPILRKMFVKHLGIRVPERLLTKRFAHAPAQSNTGQFQCYVWEVLPVPNRTDFDPRDSRRFGLRHAAD